MKFGFNQIELVLREEHHIRDDRAIPFRARLRYLQRTDGIGIPRGGAGRKANYGAAHVLLLSFCVHMEQFGLSPEQIADALSECRSEFKSAVYEVGSRAGDIDRPVMIWFYPEALAPLSQLGVTCGSFCWVEMSDMMASIDSSLPRFAIINLTDIANTVLAGLAGEDNISALYDELIDWASDEDPE